VGALTTFSPDEIDKIRIMNRYRQFAILGSILGSVFCSATLYIPFNDVWHPFQLDAFTVPVLTSALFEFLFAIALVLFLKDIPSDSSSIQGTFGNEAAKSLFVTSVSLNVGNFLVFLGMWMFFSELVILGALYWKVIHSFNTIWHAYIPVLIGAFASFLAVRILTKRFHLKNWHLMIYAPPVAALSCILLFRWNESPSSTLFFVGGSFVFLSQGVYQTGTFDCSAVHLFEFSSHNS
jgi:hypothetical protein